MSRRRKLNPEEEELWDKVRRTADPMHPVRRKKRIEEDADWLPKPVRKAVPRSVETPAEVTAGLKPFVIGSKAKMGRKRTHDLAPAIEDDIAGAPLNMHKKTHTQMKRGRLDPEARIDLHGLTLAQAHPTLVAFIMRSYTAGHRLVLVITGKGKVKDTSGPIPERHGALRHQVPHWLQMPPLSPIVLQVRNAHLKHGGGGAYYIYLRRNRSL